MSKPDTGEEGLGVIVPFGVKGDFIVAAISAQNLAARLSVIRSAYAVARSFPHSWR